MKRIRPICNWSDSQALMELIERQYAPTCPDRPFQWALYGQVDGYVVFNQAPKGFNEAKEKVLGIIQEPPDHNFADHRMRWAGKVISCYERPDAELLPSMFYQLSGNYDLHKQDYSGQKVHRMSMVASNIRGGFYEKRHSLINAILKTDMDIHIYGRGLEAIYNDPRVKGSIQHKQDALIPYEYSICVENGLHRGYTSDKLTDAIICQSVPLYLGSWDSAKRAFSNCFIDISIHTDEAMHTIKHTYQHGQYSNHSDQLKVGKMLYFSRNILTEINRWAATL